MTGELRRGSNALSKAVFEVLGRNAIWIVGRRSKGDWIVAEDRVEEYLVCIKLASRPSSDGGKSYLHVP